MAQFRAPQAVPQAAPLAGLIADIEDKDGPRAAYAALQARLRAMKTEGAQVPANLVRMEQRLLTECYAMSQGR